MPGQESNGESHGHGQRRLQKSVEAPRRLRALGQARTQPAARPQSGHGGGQHQGEGVDRGSQQPGERPGPGDLRCQRSAAGQEEKEHGDGGPCLACLLRRHGKRLCGQIPGAMPGHQQGRTTDCQLHQGSREQHRAGPPAGHCQQRPQDAQGPAQGVDAIETPRHPAGFPRRTRRCPRKERQGGAHQGGHRQQDRAGHQRCGGNRRQPLHRAGKEDCRRPGQMRKAERHEGGATAHRQFQQAIEHQGVPGARRQASAPGGPQGQSGQKDRSHHGHGRGPMTQGPGEQIGPANLLHQGGTAGESEEAQQQRRRRPGRPPDLSLRGGHGRRRRCWCASH